MDAAVKIAPINRLSVKDACSPNKGNTNICAMMATP